VVHGNDGEWVRYWRSPDGDVEAMHARFRGHAYHRHSHDTFSFGVTDAGAQSFTCRGAEHTSAAGMVMALNADDPHDGHASSPDGFTYRMIHVSPATLTGVMEDAAGRPQGLPLFAEPALADPVLAAALRRLHAALESGTRLRREEQLTTTLLTLVRRAGTQPRLAEEATKKTPARTGAQLARRVRRRLDDAEASDVALNELAEAARCSRFAVYRAFHDAYGLAPSEYQRQVRLRTARRLLASGEAPAQAAAYAGFADQAHLTRWFVRCFGVTPGGYRRAATRRR
jgi:AraC-like DNA-binding protein